MRILGIGLASLLLVSACGPTDFARETKTQLSRQKSQRAANIAYNNAIWDQRQGYIVAGSRYDVAVSPDRSYALVAPIGQESFTLGEVETAASAVTGCSARGDSFLYMLGAGPGTRLPISALQNVQGRTRVALSC